MTVLTKYFAAATCSWIDSLTGLPEVDQISVTFDSVSRAFLTGNRGYRFCNFMEVWVSIDLVKKTVVSRGFTPSSGIYRAPSYKGIPSHAFPTQQDIFSEIDAIRFTQVVGARTVSPEVLGAAGGIVGGALTGGAAGALVPVVGPPLGALIGGVAGGLVGEIGARQYTHFPPIWSKVQIRMYNSGRTEVQLLQHSLFPSLTFYQPPETAGLTPQETFSRVAMPNGLNYYRATKEVELPRWKDGGWGCLQYTSLLGPVRGNPWGIQKGYTGGADVLPSPIR